MVRPRAGAKKAAGDAYSARFRFRCRAAASVYFIGFIEENWIVVSPGYFLIRTSEPDSL
jgi:hypothetical protein